MKDPTRVSSGVLVSYHDESNVWPVVSQSLAQHLPLVNLPWRNGLGNEQLIPELHLDFVPESVSSATITNTSPSRTPGHLFRTLVPPKRPTLQEHDEVFLYLYFVTCEDLEHYRSTTRPALRLWIESHVDHHSCVVYTPMGTASPTLSKKILDKIKADMSPRVVRLDIFQSGQDAQWLDFLTTISQSIRLAFEERRHLVEQELKQVDALRMSPEWDFFKFLKLKENLIQMYRQAQFYDDAVRYYDEIEAIFSTIPHTPGSFSDTNIWDISILDASHVYLESHSASVHQVQLYLFLHQFFILVVDQQDCTRAIQRTLAFVPDFGPSHVWKLRSFLELGQVLHESVQTQRGSQDIASQSAMGRFFHRVYYYQRTSSKIHNLTSLDRAIAYYERSSPLNQRQLNKCLVDRAKDGDDDDDDQLFERQAQGYAKEGWTECQVQVLVQLIERLERRQELKKAMKVVLEVCTLVFRVKSARSQLRPLVERLIVDLSSNNSDVEHLISHPLAPCLYVGFEGLVPPPQTTSRRHLLLYSAFPHALLLEKARLTLAYSTGPMKAKDQNLTMDVLDLLVLGENSNLNLDPGWTRVSINDALDRMLFRDYPHLLYTRESVEITSVVVETSYWSFSSTSTSLEQELDEAWGSKLSVHFTPVSSSASAHEVRLLPLYLIPHLSQSLTLSIASSCFEPHVPESSTNVTLMIQVDSSSSVMMELSDPEFSIKNHQERLPLPRGAWIECPKEEEEDSQSSSHFRWTSCLKWTTSSQSQSLEFQTQVKVIASPTPVSTEPKLTLTLVVSTPSRVVPVTQSRLIFSVLRTALDLTFVSTSASVGYLSLSISPQTCPPEFQYWSIATIECHWPDEINVHEDHLAMNNSLHHVLPLTYVPRSKLVAEAHDMIQLTFRVKRKNETTLPSLSSLSAKVSLDCLVKQEAEEEPQRFKVDFPLHVPKSLTDWTTRRTSSSGGRSHEERSRIQFHPVGGIDLGRRGFTQGQVIPFRLDINPKVSLLFKDRLRYQLVVEPTEWMVCGRTCGTYRHNDAPDAQAFCLDLLPLSTGCLRIPTIELLDLDLASNVSEIYICPPERMSSGVVRRPGSG